MRESGFSVRFVAMDAGDRSSVDAMAEKTLEAYDRVDTLVNNAGITGGSAPLRDQSDEKKKLPRYRVRRFRSEDSDERIVVPPDDRAGAEGNRQVVQAMKAFSLRLTIHFPGDKIRRSRRV